MTRFIYLYYSCCFLLLSSFTYAQNYDEQLIEDYLPIDEQDQFDFTQQIDDLTETLEHPLNINTATYEELEALIFLNDIQINNILDYRDRTGMLISIYELKNINGIDDAIFNRLKPFIIVEKPREIKQFQFASFLKGKNELKIRSEIGSAPTADTTNTNQNYLGSPLKLYCRYRYYSENLSLGVTAKKDAGEQFFKGSQPSGFDFYSAHLQLKNIGKLKTLNLGDYQLNYGQGLTLWSGFGVFKSLDPLQIQRNESGINKYASTNESKFFRGIAGTVKFKTIEVSSFLSSKQVDANLVGKDQFTEFQQTGYHRTISEVNDKNSVNTFLYGGHIGYFNNSLKVGLTSYQVIYNKEKIWSVEPYKQFNFHGNENYCIGSDFQYKIGKLNCFGEISRSKNRAIASIIGIKIGLSSMLSLALMYRNYDKAYQNLYGRAFGKNSLNQNEQGIYTGLVFMPYNSLTISSSIDIYHYDWLKYNVDAPSKGCDWLMKVDLAIASNWKLFFLIHQNVKQQNSSELLPTRRLEEVIKTNYRIHISNTLSKKLIMQNRVEFLRYITQTQTPRKGYLMYQDLNYKISRLLDCTFRYQLYNADDYDCRIYCYESGLQNSFTFPAYYGEGVRIYLIIHYQSKKDFGVWIKTGETINESNLKQELMIEFIGRF